MDTPPAALSHDFRLILASTSPRRYFLLREAGIPFDAAPPKDIAEDIRPDEPPEKLVARHAMAKARSVAGEYPGRLVLGADTIVVVDGRVFGKPHDSLDAHRMLAALAGRDHVVYTGLALLDGARGRELAEVEATDVRLRPLTAEEIDIYIATGEPLDKAGGYAIQGKGAFLVEKVDGDYFNVVGLPLCRLGFMLAKLGYTVFG